MKNKPVQFRYSVHQEVLIAPLNVRGKIFARCDRGDAHDYRVVYYYDGQRRDDWLYEFELTTTKGN